MFRGMFTHRASTDGTGPYPELEPGRYNRNAVKVFTQAVETARTMPRWRNFQVDPDTRTLKCEAVTRLFKFVDDVEIRVDEDNGEAVVHVRSRSRVGKGDLGANVKRVRTFLTALEDELAS